MATDLNYTIMKERLTAGVDMVRAEAERAGLPMSEALFIKGIEVGISLFIQKGREYVNRP